MSSSSQLKREDVELTDVVLGYGSYSKVILGRNKHTGEQYAVKTVSKLQILNEKKVHYVMNERDTLRRLKHPNIVRLHSTYQTSEELFFVLDHCSGGELQTYIKEMGPFTLQTAQTIAAEIVNALEYLHQQGVVHRDVKPENILLDSASHIKLVDFGTAFASHDEPEPMPDVSAAEQQAAQAAEVDIACTLEATLPKTMLTDQQELDASEIELLTSRPSTLEVAEQEPEGVSPGAGSKGQRSQSFCGTAQYASPELLVNCSTSYASDLWALGCIIFQMLTGERPFRDHSDYLTFKRILERDVNFPEDMPEIGRDLCDSLLQLDPVSRLGVGPGGFERLKAHPFFQGIDFAGLPRQKLQYTWQGKGPVWVPDSESPTCTGCNQGFTLFFRRHHCRACGKVFCRNCAKGSMRIPHLNYIKCVRVCRTCQTQLESGMCDSPVAGRTRLSGSFNSITPPRSASSSFNT